MASYKKLGNNNWKYIISYTDQSGNYRQKSKQGFKTKRAAQDVAEQLEREIKNNVHVTDGDTLFSDYYTKWINTYKIGVFSNETDKIYKTSEKLVHAHFEGLKLKNVSKDKYQQFINDYSKGRSKETVRKIHNKIGGCLRHAFHTGVIPVDVTYKTAITGQLGKSASDKFLEEQELKKLILALQDGLSFSQVSRYMLLLQASTGARIGEVMALTFDNFNFKNETLTINKSWDYKFEYDFKNTKNGVHRVIDLDPDTMKMIKPFYDYKRKEMLSSPIPNTHKLVFVNNYMMTISPNAINKSLGRACERAGIKKVTSHALRHTHASMLLLHGVDVQIVAERLGDTVDVVTKVYAHVLQSMRDNNKPLIKLVSSSVFK